MLKALFLVLLFTVTISATAQQAPRLPSPPAGSVGQWQKYPGIHTDPGIVTSAPASAPSYLYQACEYEIFSLKEKIKTLENLVSSQEQKIKLLEQKTQSASKK